MKHPKNMASSSAGIIYIPLPIYWSSVIEFELCRSGDEKKRTLRQVEWKPFVNVCNSIGGEMGDRRGQHCRTRTRNNITAHTHACRHEKTIITQIHGLRPRGRQHIHTNNTRHPSHEQHTHNTHCKDERDNVKKRRNEHRDESNCY